LSELYIKLVVHGHIQFVVAGIGGRVGDEPKAGWPCIQASPSELCKSATLGANQNIHSWTYLQTNEFKEIMTKAKAQATTLPGGDMSVLNQDEVIHMLERLRDYKRQGQI
jgi:hypothetical protein